ncbi:M57 family metalloprotease [uncultured Polaribacter sp.]|uniref:M57 family metalloprotease n=1 Tax=uncultured Polaribacter sp. TaxID=174711 RepID=UPI002608C644|nr:M57 family metalloprotease [uncultured Polaribacter sp.]
MKKFKLLTLVMTIILMQSCENNDDLTLNEENSIIPKEIVNKLIDSNLIISDDDISLNNFTTPTGEIVNEYLINGDIGISINQVMDLNDSNNLSAKHSSSKYLVSTNKQTIYITALINSSNYGLSSTARTATKYTVTNFNRLDLEFNFVYNERELGDLANSDIVVYQDRSLTQDSSVRGLAGFPYSNGNPYKWARINTTANNKSNTTYNRNLLEGLITHEIGHCMGLRHTDWENKGSCRLNIKETGTANHISGTPSAVYGSRNFDYESIMQACFPVKSGTKAGEFSAYDKVALRSLYQE